MRILSKGSAVALATLLLGYGLCARGRADVPEQAPIDIRASEAIAARLPSLQFRYRDSTSLTLVNTGSPDEHATIRADVPADAGTLEIGPKKYRLVQFHWHTPAEHLLDGKRYPMEMHLVHQAEDGTLTVVGVFVKEGRADPELDRVFGHLPRDKQHSESLPSFHLAQLLPKKRKSYRYFGSLTTPPFKEGVRWNVLAEPITLSHAQIEAFHALFHEGNSRPVQPLLNRVVLTEL